MKRLLVVVDFQNDFVCGSLGFENAKLLEKHIVSVIQDYQNHDDDVIYTMDTHQDNYLDTYEGKNLPIKHCIENTEGWELYGKLKNYFKIVCALKNLLFPL